MQVWYSSFVCWGNSYFGKLASNDGNSFLRTLPLWQRTKETLSEMLRLVTTIIVTSKCSSPWAKEPLTMTLLDFFSGKSCEVDANRKFSCRLVLFWMEVDLYHWEWVCSIWFGHPPAGVPFEDVMTKRRAGCTHGVFCEWMNDIFFALAESVWFSAVSLARAGCVPPYFCELFD